VISLAAAGRFVLSMFMRMPLHRLVVIPHVCRRFVVLARRLGMSIVKLLREHFSTNVVLIVKHRMLILLVYRIRE
jgi:hypothetical protein